MAGEVLEQVLKVPLPAHREARVESADLTQFEPVEYQSDTITVLWADKPMLAVVVEVQRGRDPGKRWSWPVYLASIRARLKCPALLLVICTDPGIARWCAKTIDMGHPGWNLTPLVADPGAVPLITDAETAIRSPELAVLSAVTHGGQDDAQPVLEACLAALTVVDDERARLYADFVFAMLPEAARKNWEVLMAVGTYEYQSDFAKKYVAEGREEGKAEGKAEAVLVLLAGRGVPVPGEMRDRIMQCTDTTLLDTWIQRAATATTAADLFDRPSRHHHPATPNGCASPHGGRSGMT
ncbi:hypothetical protein Sru01_44340 [Sphaerisporangium rufum]|uniref:Transposase (putative) YhgA-like domain-containing protein n=1 Tax=Sphaerisporangium rufum TaxID=1381558 RepID=A0A919V292_9ACTN|nr:hypothetical protein Sru01_44340 [Sphaerisporangium rufum]